MKENQLPAVKWFIVSIGELAPDGKSVRPQIMMTAKGSVPNKLETIEPLWTLSMGMSDQVAPWLLQAGVVKLTPQHLVDVQAMLSTLNPIAIPQARSRLNWLANWMQEFLVDCENPVIVVETK